MSISLGDREGGQGVSVAKNLPGQTESGRGSNDSAWSAVSLYFKHCDTDQSKVSATDLDSLLGDRGGCQGCVLDQAPMIEDWAPKAGGPHPRPRRSTRLPWRLALQWRPRDGRPGSARGALRSRGCQLSRRGGHLWQ